MGDEKCATVLHIFLLLTMVTSRPVGEKLEEYSSVPVGQNYWLKTRLTSDPLGRKLLDKNAKDTIVNQSRNRAPQVPYFLISGGYQLLAQWAKSCPWRYEKS